MGLRKSRGFDLRWMLYRPPKLGSAYFSSEASPTFILESNLTSGLWTQKYRYCFDCSLKLTLFLSIVVGKGLIIDAGISREERLNWIEAWPISAWWDLSLSYFRWKKRNSSGNEWMVSVLDGRFFTNEGAFLFSWFCDLVFNYCSFESKKFLCTC